MKLLICFNFLGVQRHLTDLVPKPGLQTPGAGSFDQCPQRSFTVSALFALRLLF